MTERHTTAMTGVDDERAALRTLLRRTPSDAVWRALARDGWLEAVPELDGQWATAAIAALVVAQTAQMHPRLPVGAHLAAAATIGPADVPLAVVTDAVVAEGIVCGAVWGPPWSEEERPRAVTALPDGQLLMTRLEPGDDDPSPLLLLDRVGSRRVAVALDRWTPVTGDGADHEARTAFLLAAAAVGVAASATERTLAHVRQRTQFGKPLGAQQSVGHRVVDMRTADLVGQALIDRAATAWAVGTHEDARPLSWLAKVHAGDRSVWTVEQAIQLHGALGFSEEYGLGDHLRLTQLVRLLLGGPDRAARLSGRAPEPGKRRPRDWSLAFDPS
jgi:hypothetical protein